MGTFSIVFYCSNISHLHAGSFMFSIILDREPRLTSASNYINLCFQLFCLSTV